MKIWQSEWWVHIGILHYWVLFLMFKVFWNEKKNVAQGSTLPAITVHSLQWRKHQGSCDREECVTDLSRSDRSMSDFSMEMRSVPSWFSLSRLCCSFSSSEWHSSTSWLKDKIWSFSCWGKIVTALLKTISWGINFFKKYSSSQLAKIWQNVTD